MARNSGIVFGNFSGVGRVREKNEDYYGSFALPLGNLFVVCDGMGGHRGGQRASQLAVEEIHGYLESTAELEPLVFLGRAIERANDAVLDEARGDDSLKGMGTTCVMLLVRPGSKPEAWIAHVGDSRIYRFRNGRLSRLTRDHSKVQKMVDMGIISPAEAAEHPQKNVITKAIGIEESIFPDVTRIEICRKDRLLLCTDGVTDLVPDDDLQKMSATGKDAQKLAEQIIALSDERGGHDNATIQVIDVTRGPKPPREPGPRGSRGMRLLVAVLLAIITILVIWKAFGSGEGGSGQDGATFQDSSGADSLSPPDTLIENPVDGPDSTESFEATHIQEEAGATPSAEGGHAEAEGAVSVPR